MKNKDLRRTQSEKTKFQEFYDLKKVNFDRRY